MKGLAADQSSLSLSCFGFNLSGETKGWGSIGEERAKRRARPSLQHWAACWATDEAVEVDLSGFGDRNR